MPDQKDDNEEKKAAGLPPIPTPGEGAPPVSSEPGLPSAPQQGLPEKMPDIPSFRPGATDAKKGAGGLGLFGRGSGANAGLKLRGLANSSSLVDRLKQLRKKDLIFIASGLSVLLLAPLAEHFVLGPGEDSNVLKQGFDSKGGPFVEANPYETGTGMATGNLPGQTSDVITPLNVRDPMSLIFGAGTQQAGAAGAGAGAGGAGSGSGSTSKEGWKDAISEASRAGARTAIDSGGLPAPKGNLSGSLRGLSALSGASYGGGPTFTLGPVNAAVGGSKGGGSNMAPVTATAGYKGPAARGLDSASSIEALRRAADNAGNMFNGRGSAADNLQKAAQEAIPSGGGSDGMGGPGKGQDGKNPGGNSSKDTKSMGESLAFLRAKMEMEKAVDLKWKKIEWETFGRQKMEQEELIKMGFGILKTGIADPFAKSIAGIMKGAFGIHEECYVCDQNFMQVDAGTKICASACPSDDKSAASGSSICSAFNTISNGNAPGYCHSAGGAKDSPGGAQTGNTNNGNQENTYNGNQQRLGQRKNDLSNPQLAQECKGNAACDNCRVMLSQAESGLSQLQTNVKTDETALSDPKNGAKKNLEEAGKGQTSAVTESTTLLQNIYQQVHDNGGSAQTELANAATYATSGDMDSAAKSIATACGYLKNAADFQSKAPAQIKKVGAALQESDNRLNLVPAPVNKANQNAVACGKQLSAFSPDSIKQNCAGFMIFAERANAVSGDVQNTKQSCDSESKRIQEISNAYGATKPPQDRFNGRNGTKENLEASRTSYYQPIADFGGQLTSLGCGACGQSAGAAITPNGCNSASNRLSTLVSNAGQSLDRLKQDVQSRDNEVKQGVDATSKIGTEPLLQPVAGK